MFNKYFIILLYILLIGSSCEESCDKTTVVEPPLLLSFFCGENSEEEICIKRKELGIIYNSLEYPKEALENNIEGIVVVKFLVDIYGLPIELEIKEGIGYGCDEEALEFAQNLNYEPAKNECGDNVVSNMTYDLKFEIQ